VHIQRTAKAVNEGSISSKPKATASIYIYIYKILL
jgi:hypothetical protein